MIERISKFEQISESEKADILEEFSKNNEVWYLMFLHKSGLKEKHFALANRLYEENPKNFKLLVHYSLAQFSNIQ